jgi:hypothetical protein
MVYHVYCSGVENITHGKGSRRLWRRISCVSDHLYCSRRLWSVHHLQWPGKGSRGLSSQIRGVSEGELVHRLYQQKDDIR